MQPQNNVKPHNNWTEEDIDLAMFNARIGLGYQERYKCGHRIAVPGVDTLYEGDDVHNPLYTIPEAKLMLLDHGRPADLCGVFAEPEDYIKEMIWFMSKPENFAFTVKLLFNIELDVFQLFILQELWRRKFPMLLATRGGGKTWILSLYAMLRALINQGRKIVVVGAAFRQSKLLFEYMEGFWKQAPLVQSLVGSGKGQGPKRDIDRCNFYVGDSEIIAIPLGDGTKIRGLRANYTIADEFASIPLEIFEVVIKGFASVSAAPTKRADRMTRIKILQDIGRPSEAQKEIEALGFGNQTIVSGTAYYSFNHFYDYWKRYCEIVKSRGNSHRLEEIFNGEIPDGFDWTEFSVIRAPYQCLPTGFMDETQIAQAKATIHRSTYLMEYGACFADDSDGFFRRSLIESCVTNQPINTPVSGPVQFACGLQGDSRKKYVYGIDPASEADNFAIVILECYGDHRRIVYSWTINRQEMRQRMKNKGQTQERSFYVFCARKIRDLMKLFPTEHIVIDSQGGGHTIAETLRDVKELEEGEMPLLPYVKDGDDDIFWWEEADKPTDKEAGLHILHVVNFANAKFIYESNHGLRKDLEDKKLLFPFFDSVELANSAANDKIMHREYDTLEDAMMELEELKDELSTIIHTQTTSGRDKWDTPEVKLPGGKKGRLRKDRYSALLIGNMAARVMINESLVPDYAAAGGYAGQKRVESGDGRLYVGPDNLVKKMTGIYGKGVYKR
jgi:hypothetical protein